jgi:phospholipid/cholesterol/gamma-HCH transport system substrate-binding protein
VGRIAAIVALAGAVLVAALMLLGGGDKYTVTANFENASQLVKGNQVKVGGVPAGSINDISLADDGTALVEMEISGDHQPIPAETVAIVRSGSLSSIAGRSIELQMPEGDAGGGTIEDGGTLPISQTVSAVDLDHLFNTFDEETIGNFKKVIKGFAASYEGVGPQTNAGFKYLNPFLSTSRRVFAELTADERRFERLLIDGASLSGAVAERSEDLEQFVSNTNRMMGAIASENVALADAVGKLPNFMRNFNTTAVNLRATLDDVDPLVDASIPVARKLQPFTAALRGFATDAVPTVRRLDAIVRRPGEGNDLTDLTLLQPRLARIAVGPVNRNGASRPGAFPAAVDSLEGSSEQLAHFRAYTPELVAWFDDFGHSGVYDANGGMGRISTTFNAFTLSPTTGLPDLVTGVIDPADFGSAGLIQDYTEKCPGTTEPDPGDSSVPFTDNGNLDCDPSQVIP